MSRATKSRLAKLEAAAAPKGRRIPLFFWGKSEAEIAAMQEDLLRSRDATPNDTFLLFTWMEPSERSEEHGSAGRMSIETGLILERVGLVSG